MRTTIACLFCGLSACASAVQEQPETPQSALRPVEASIQPAAKRGAEIGRLSARCEAGDGTSCWWLSYAYRQGKAFTSLGAEVVTKDIRRAAYYAGKGCALDDMSSCSSLAEYYRNGDGVHQDLEKAVQLHAKVCNGPVGTMTQFSCGTLGDMLVKGVGERNFFMGIIYLSRACALGNEFGCRMHDRYAGTGRVSDREPPKGAAGFTFGWSSIQARTACADLHGKWSPKEKLVGGKTSSCELHVSALDHDVTATLGFVDDHLVWISADYEPDQGRVIEEHTRVGDLLVESHGIPSGRKSVVLDACGRSFALCLARKEAEFEMWWYFKDDQHCILLSLVGSPNGKVALSLVYTAPGSDRLTGHLEL